MGAIRLQRSRQSGGSWALYAHSAPNSWEDHGRYTPTALPTVGRMMGDQSWAIATAGAPFVSPAADPRNGTPNAKPPPGGRPPPGALAGGGGALPDAGGGEPAAAHRTVEVRVAECEDPA